ncbi:MAG: sigma-70 family RNA polymerase sigma factor [Cyclobacteriaceae bacterium]|nr:sigma-70 family RNA polymerase sigma factor [Cyclobacteriaceae bacterium]
MDVDQLTDIDIIARVLSGEKDLFKGLVERYQDYVYTLALRILKNKAEAEEAAQDTFIKAYKSLALFKKEAKFSTWIYRIACNTAISYRRKWKKHENIDIIKISDNKADDIRDSVEYGDKKRFVRQAIDSLSQEEAMLITLFYFKDLSMEEISSITSLKVSTAKVKLFRARKKLGEVLRHILKEEVLNL